MRFLVFYFKRKFEMLMKFRSLDLELSSANFFEGENKKKKIVIRKWFKLIIIKKAFKLRLLISIWSFDYKLKL